MRSILLLLAASILVWAALLYPGWLLEGPAALLHSTTAWALCAVPALIAAGWALRPGHSPEMRTLAVLGGSGIRLAVTLGGGLVLADFFPEAFPKVFWLWVGVFYMLLLILEVVVLVRSYQSHASIS